jgi:hypothetical protein
VPIIRFQHLQRCHENMPPQDSADALVPYRIDKTKSYRICRAV